MQCSPREMSGSNSANVVGLNDFSRLPDYNLVTVVIKVLKVYQKVEVKPGLKKTGHHYCRCRGDCQVDPVAKRCRYIKGGRDI